MPLATGDKLGPYEILVPLGAGGMGEVYKAKDTRLERIVAVKVSKTEFSDRFEREARAVAALNHPNICTLHDVGPNYLVFEYVEGAPLKGPMPLVKALEYAAQICDALDAAHKKGIIHRDLKPGNILVTRSGVKLLDFGLAKIESPVLAEERTLTMALTGRGEILGTLHYMSPEQLQGQDATPASDIFSFGLVLYEMLTGKRAFDGASPASVIAAILEREAPSVVDVAPTALDRVLKRCLDKNPDNRWQSARDLQINLEWVNAAETGDAPPQKKSRRELAIVGGLVVALGIAILAPWRKPPQPPSLAFQLDPPEGERLLGLPAISPDGAAIAERATGTAGLPHLLVRRLASLNWEKLPGTEGATAASWSPDSRSLAFASGTKLKRIEVAGGPAQTLCDFPSGWIPFTAWTEDGWILFSGLDGIRRVPASGGTPIQITTIDPSRGEDLHGVPQPLPGRRFLYFARSTQADKSGMYEASLDLRPADQGRKLVFGPSSSAAVYARGSGNSHYLLFQRDEALMAQSLHLNPARLDGEPFLAAAEVGLSGTALAASVSRTGLLAYVSARSASGVLSQFSWYDRSGKVLGDAGPPANYTEFSLAPDEKRLAVARSQEGTNGRRDIWILETAPGRGGKRFTFDSGTRRFPVWSPDGRRIIFADRYSGPGTILQKPLDGGPATPFAAPAGQPTDWSRDGRSVLYQADGDLWVWADGKPVRITQSPSNEGSGQFSPDGKWIAYVSDESKRNEIWVQSFPPSGAKWQISSTGGTQPTWSRNGNELFYYSADYKLMSVPVHSGHTFEFGTPTVLFDVPRSSNIPIDLLSYAVSADGQRFLIREIASDLTRTPVTVITNWLNVRGAAR